MTLADKTAKAQSEALSFELDLKPGGQPYGWSMMGGKLIELLARLP